MTKEVEEMQIWSDDVAAIVVDAMVDAKLVELEKFKDAVEVASLEILVRLICGDYPPPCKPKQLTRNA
ncbi:MAG TPA: hypothetical protein VF599_17705 [Pyrinomonadaceae bacterium]|jgi:hypothetical protein